MTKKIFSDEFRKMNGDKLSSVDIPFNKTIKNNLIAENVQDAIDELSESTGGTTTAQNVSFDGSINGDKLLSTNVQDAIDELTDNFETIAGNYSTTEKDTGRNWIDGYSIYCKVVATGALPNNTTKTIAHGISGIRNIVEYRGWAKDGATTHRSLVYAEYNTNVIVTYVDATNITIITRTNYASWSGYVVLFYTKN